jgi:hypothetical protein
MAFPIKPKYRSGATGNPTSLNLAELAVNTFDGSLYLGADAGVMLLNGPVAAGTVVTEHTGNGSATAFTFSGYNGTADGGYIVSVGGIDQPPSVYSISNTAGGTITFSTAPVAGELISIRAIVAGSGGGGDGNATKIQGRDVANTAPTDGQVLSWNATTSKWEPTSLNGSVSFSSAGTHTWAVPAWVRWVYVNAAAGNGSDGTATDGGSGETGLNAYFDESSNPVAATTGANGSDGNATAGAAGKGISIAALGFNVAGGTAGSAGTPGLGGGGSGGAGIVSIQGQIYSAPGAAGNGSAAGQGGNNIFGGAAGGGASPGSDGGGSIGYGGSGVNHGGTGGIGGVGDSYNGGGGGGADGNSGGGGGAGGMGQPGSYAGAPGAGGTADTSMCAGGAGQTLAAAVNFSSVAGTTISIVISEGEGNASISIAY